MSKRVASVIVKPKSLTASLQKVRLPAVVFHVSSDSYRITRLVNLKFDEGDQQGACGCSNILGDESVFDGGPTSDPQHYNKHQVEAKDCYSTLTEAKAAITYGKRKDERDCFVSKHNSYSNSQSNRIRLLRQHPDLVLCVMKDEFIVDEDSQLTLETLKVSHYREVAKDKLYKTVVAKIIDREFPDLMNDDADEDDEA